MAAVNRITKCVFHADLRCSHVGLHAIAKDLEIELDNLKPGEVVVFMNTARTQMKLFGYANTIVHFKKPDESRIDLRTLELIPKFFNGRAFDYTAALKQTITQELTRKGKWNSES